MRSSCIELELVKKHLLAFRLQVTPWQAAGSMYGPPKRSDEYRFQARLNSCFGSFLLFAQNFRPAESSSSRVSQTPTWSWRSVFELLRHSLPSFAVSRCQTCSQPTSIRPVCEPFSLRSQLGAERRRTDGSSPFSSLFGFHTDAVPIMCASLDPYALVRCAPLPIIHLFPHGKAVADSSRIRTLTPYSVLNHISRLR